MLHYTNEKILPYGRSDLFDLILDIDAYPKFLPWVLSSKVMEQDRKTSSFFADLSIGYQLFHETYTSRVTFAAHDWIKAEHVKGPFKHMTTLWTLSDVQGHTNVHFSIDCAFQSFILQKVLESVIREASMNIIDAFEKRARNILRI